MRPRDNLAHALRRAHDVRGVYRLVGRNHHKTADVIFFTQLNYVQRAKYVIFHCFYAVLFHERHMLMRGCMNNDMRLVFLHDAAHCRFAADAGDFYLKVQLALIA